MTNKLSARQVLVRNTPMCKKSAQADSVLFIKAKGIAGYVAAKWCPEKACTAAGVE